MLKDLHEKMKTGLKDELREIISNNNNKNI